MSKFTQRKSGHHKMDISVRFTVDKIDIFYAIYQLKDAREKITRKSILRQVRENFTDSGYKTQCEDSLDEIESESRSLEPLFLKLFPDWKPFNESIAGQYRLRLLSKK